MPTGTDRARDRARWWGIHDRETYICPDCGRTADEVRRWEVHHLDGEAGNVVGLCQTCHRVRHGADRRRIDLETWKAEFLAVGE